MLNKNIFFIVLILVSSACHQKKLSKTTATEIQKVIVDMNYNVKDSIANYTIDSAKVNADTLSLFINYSGGCKTHSFDLYSNEAYAKSFPPQTTVYLKHKDNGDACRELITKELKFNIAELKYTGPETVNTGQVTVIINVGKNHRVSYTK